MRIAFYLDKKYEKIVDDVSRFFGSKYNLAKTLFLVGLFMLTHGLEPEHLVIISKLLENPIDEVEKELREGLEKGIEIHIKRIASLVDSFIRNLVMTGEYIVGWYFGKSAPKVIVKYRRKIRELRERKKEEKIMWKEIEEIGEIIDEFSE